MLEGFAPGTTKLATCTDLTFKKPAGAEPYLLLLVLHRCLTSLGRKVESVSFPFCESTKNLCASRGAS